MRPHRHPHAGSQIVFGLFVIALGLLFLLDNLGLFDFRFSLHLLPMLLVLFGVMKIVQSRSTQGLVVGGALVAAGVLLTLRSMGLLDLSWRMVWPVLMIGAGVSVVLRSVGGRRHTMLAEDGGLPPTPGDDAVINLTAIMGGYKRRLASPGFRGGEVTVVMGGCELDLRQCGLQGDAELNVFALFGGIQIQVPPDWTVLMYGTPVLGGFEERTTVPPDTGKRLIVKGYAIMGGVEVRN
ncbi:hypothetical protein H3H37_01980 [Duganella sp. LX20W]|uniref:LiaF transmembrane domain-containing protein n=1 Tax=Rugamonas brunnea TaxID=2758569 RepID=A0A7W2IA59_9BURK|nr:DUF5668 domain-containing protein [Rugamonas brunnea]MBA5635818.1 hypothetical protein [Rugamonas brunnea]